jgi:hypothetical protein
MRINPKIVAILVCSMMISVASADVLEMKDGQVLNGKYAGGTAGTLRFETSTGVQVLETSQIVALTFTTAPAAPAAASAPPPADVPVAPPAQAITIPAGTPLLVRMMDSISSKNKPGTRFTTTLEQDLVVNGVVVVKAGTKIYGELRSAKQAGRAVGKSEIDIRLTQLALGNEMPLIATSSFTDKGKSSGAKTVGAAAVGAGVGAVVNGGEGAKKGAAIAGGASLLKKGDTVTVPPGSLLEFTLTQPLNVKVQP